MLTRRSLLAMAVALPGMPSGNTLRFRLFREGSVIGVHELRFERQRDGLTIAIDVDIAVRFGPIVLYRYKLSGSETWRGGECVAASSRTNDDGKQFSMRVHRDSRGLAVEGTGIQPYLAPADALVASHWNPNELHCPWINLQSGALLQPRVAALGPDPVLLANGSRIPATCFRITGPARMRLWYTPASVWTGLLFHARDQSVVRYERVL
jgi:Domain of unknown function (DUF6134)